VKRSRCRFSPSNHKPISLRITGMRIGEPHYAQKWTCYVKLNANPTDILFQRAYIYHHVIKSRLTKIKSMASYRTCVYLQILGIKLRVGLKYGLFKKMDLMIDYAVSTSKTNKIGSGC